MIANTLDMDIKPGSMGMPLPGIEAAVVNRKDGGVTPCKPGEIGDLALKVGWPSMMRAYLHEEARYEKTLSGLVHFRRPRHAGPGRLLLVRRPGR
jgi:acetyl-CoA synthetase